MASTVANTVSTADSGPSLHIGLLVNMSGAARAQAQRQFNSLILAGSEVRDVKVSLFSLFHTGEAECGGIDDLKRADLDGLIVTGCEPKYCRLQDEDFWPQLTSVVDWAETHTASTVWSCLSAHAAVMHMDGIERRRLPNKCSGLYRVSKQRHHRLSTAFAPSYWTPHSRWNALEADELDAAGYGLLTSGPACGPDIFVKQWHSLFVYLQGHPEYGCETLGREYRRDVTRYRDGLSTARPSIPKNYYPRSAERQIREVEARLYRGQATSRDFETLTAIASPQPGRQSPGRPLISNWLSYLRERADSVHRQNIGRGGQGFVALQH